MVKCEFCGKELDLYFKCNYCGGLFCAEHHLPENHDCPNKPKSPPPYIKEALYRARVYDLREPKESFYLKSKKRKLKRIAVGFIKVLAFLVFTFATALPTILYAYLLFMPEMKNVLGFLFFFAGTTLFVQYILPNILYLVVWLFVVISALRHKCKWWYHLILLLISLWNWYSLIRLSAIAQFLKSMLGAFGG